MNFYFPKPIKIQKLYIPILEEKYIEYEGNVINNNVNNNIDMKQIYHLLFLFVIIIIIGFLFILKN